MEVYFTIEVAIFFILFWLFVSPILLFLPWYQWWNKYDPQRKYNCFHLFLLAYYRSNYLTYLIANIAFSAGNKNMTYKWWPEFLGYIMDGEAVGIVGTPENPGLCTPKTLCDTLVPTEYPPGPLPHIGVRWPDTVAEWKTLLANWAGFSKIPSSPESYLNGADSTTWQNSTGNFLAQWGIPAKSPAVAAFVTTTYNVGPIKVDSNALTPLLGFSISTSEGDKGGWWGYLHGISADNVSPDDAVNLLWTTLDNPVVNKAKSRQGSKCHAGGIAAGAINFAIMGAAMGASAGTAVPGIGNVVGGIGGFILGAAMGAFTGALAQPGCL